MDFVFRAEHQCYRRQGGSSHTWTLPIDLSTHEPGTNGFISFPKAGVIRDVMPQNIPAAPTGIETRLAGVRGNYAYHYTTGTATSVHIKLKCVQINSDQIIRGPQYFQKNLHS